MGTEELYRERAEEAREEAKATTDPDTRRLWLEIAEAFEWLANQPERDPVWRVERVEKKK
jgi:hypothetical protein